MLSNNISEYKSNLLISDRCESETDQTWCLRCHLNRIKEKQINVIQICSLIFECTDPAQAPKIASPSIVDCYDLIIFVQMPMLCENDSS